MQAKCALLALVVALSIIGVQGVTYKMRHGRQRLEHNHLREPQPIDPIETDDNDHAISVEEKSGEKEEVDAAAASSPPTECPSCGDGAASAEEIRKMRIEKIKQRILHKLRLKVRPNVTISRADLPTPLSHGELSRFRGDSHEPHLRYEYYGTTEHVIIFPDEESFPCFLSHQHPAECLRFSKTSGLPTGEISSAVLWVYKLDISRNESNQTHTFRVSELAPDHRNAARRKHPVDHIRTTIENGWIKFNVKHAVKNWPHHHSRKEHWLEVICHSCDTGHSESPISMELGQRPFLVLTMNTTRELQRSKRSVNCSPGTTHCCRESLFISFKEIGWDDWILQPTGYTANYCRGSCAEEGAIPLSRNYHSTMMQRYAQNQNLTPSQKISLSPCCTPARMSQISLLYIYDDGKLYQSNLPDMVVEACGCS